MIIEIKTEKHFETIPKGMGVETSRPEICHGDEKPSQRPKIENLNVMKLHGIPYPLSVKPFVISSDKFLQSFVDIFRERFRQT